LTLRAEALAVEADLGHAGAKMPGRIKPEAKRAARGSVRLEKGEELVEETDRAIALGRGHVILQHVGSRVVLQLAVASESRMTT
jgi:hypothetical protein